MEYNSGTNTKKLKTKFGGQGSTDDFRNTTIAWAGGLLAKTGSLSDHPSKQQPRSRLLGPVQKQRATHMHRPICPEVQRFYKPKTTLQNAKRYGKDFKNRG
ncbi:hypothetical protein J6590_089798 [Homalodisca vitripennis]|nr:hypothetical protein J6590_089798 [Homalodisca vitripennis]